jgi:hypothetical protein
MSRLTPTQAVARLFAAHQVDLEVEGGAPLTFAVSAVDRTRVVGLAPRLRARRGMALVGRVIGDDDRPWMVSLVVEEAHFHNEQLAQVQLHAQRVGLDGTRRGMVRHPSGGVAWLEAISCRDMPDGTRIDGVMNDLSLSGVGFTTAQVLRLDDELCFHGRFFAEEVQADVVIASLRPASHAGRTIVGARFTALDGVNRARIEHIIDGVRQPEGAANPLDIAGIRGLVTPAEQDSGGWKRMFRRSS